MAPERTRTLSAALLAAALGATSFAAAAADDRDWVVPGVDIVRSDTPPTIDGKLDEAVWQTAAVLGDFVQYNPYEGDPPTFQTEVRLVYTERSLFIGARLYDDEPEKIIAKQMRFDTDMRSGDRLNIVLDPFGDGRDGVFFQVNPLGTRSEALLENNRTFRREWDTIWYAETSVDEKGWVVEIEIPFQSIPYDADAEAWGLEIDRNIRRINESSRWALPFLNHSILNVAGIGRLRGLRDVQGTGVDVKPRISASFNKDGRDPQINVIRPPVGVGLTEAIGEDIDFRGRPSGDVFWKFLPSATAALTINTDFSDAPVDVRQTNLDRFALAFPETRDFFLQEAGIFAFGDLTRDGRILNGAPFFSRRIGLVNGSVVDIRGGLKATGRVGRWNFGGIATRTVQNRASARETLAAFRGTYNVLEESSVGFIVTNGDPEGRDSNEDLVGVDFRYRNSRFLGKRRNLNATSWYAQTGQSGEWAGGLRVEYPNDKINWNFEYRRIGPDYDPKLGFVNRPGVQQAFAAFRYRWRPGVVRTLDVGIDGQYTADFTDNEDLRTSRIIFRLLEITTHPNDILRISYIVNQEKPQGDFFLGTSAEVLADEYSAKRWFILYETSRGRPVSLAGQLNWGEFFGGQLFRGQIRVDWRPLPRFFASVEWDQSSFRRDDAPSDRDDDGLLDIDPLTGLTRFYDNNDVFRRIKVEMNVLFTPELEWTNLIQYDNITDTVGWNSRVRWELEPGNEVFVVINLGYDYKEVEEVIRPTAQQALVKVGWTFRFAGFREILDRESWAAGLRRR